MEPVQDFVLPNGLRFLVAPDPIAPAAAFSLWVRTGVCDEPPDRRGIAHFVEHMMFRGSEHFAPEEHSRRIARLGGDCNAFTLPDGTVFYETFPPEALEEAFRLEADRFRAVRFTSSDAEIERKVILEELRSYENQPFTRALRRLLEAIGGQHPYALDPLGRPADVKAVSLDDLQSFYRRGYRPPNVFAVVAGDVTREQIETMAARHFGPWEDGGPAAAPPAIPPFLPRVGTLAMRLPLEVPLVVRLHRLDPWDREDLPAVELLAALLTSGESSPLREALVKRRRWCVEAAGELFKLRHGGLLAFFAAFLPPGRHAPRRRLLAEICAELAERGPDRDRFAQHLRQFRAQRAQESYVPAERMLGLGAAELSEGDFRKYERSLEELAEVTPERVQCAARRLFAPANTLELDVHPEHAAWWLAPLGLLMKLWPIRGTAARLTIDG